MGNKRTKSHLPGFSHLPVSVLISHGQDSLYPIYHIICLFSSSFAKNYYHTDELIVVGDAVMIPDFSFTHRVDRRRALLEIVGFWHPQYLRRRLAKVSQAGREDLILLVYKSANVAEYSNSHFARRGSETPETSLKGQKPGVSDPLRAK